MLDRAYVWKLYKCTKDKKEYARFVVLGQR